MRLSAGRFFVGAALLVSSASCVDKQYDLGRLDPEITVLKTGLGYPLGYTMKRSLGELLELDLYTSIKTEENGDYYLSARPDPFQVSVRIPEGGDLTSQFEPFTFSVGPFPQSVLRDHPDARPDYSGSRGSSWGWTAGFRRLCWREFPSKHALRAAGSRLFRMTICRWFPGKAKWSSRMRSFSILFLIT